MAIKIFPTVSGAPDLKQDQEARGGLGALIHVEHFYKGGEALGSRSRGCFTPLWS
jgi:hypothetical protein